MARSGSNKYATVNFNEIYGNKSSSLSSASSSAVHPPPPSSSSSSVRPRFPSNGGMLVLTRPSKPKAQPAPSSDLHHPPIAASPSIAPEKHENPPTHNILPEIRLPTKPEPFVPPHRRPGFTGEGCKVSESTRPKSGGSLESRGRVESNVAEKPRPGSAGNRVTSNGMKRSPLFFHFPVGSTASNGIWRGS